MNRLVKRPSQVGFKRFQTVQQRQFVFVIVPILGAGVAALIGGAITIYGMEKYRIYKMNKEQRKADEEIKVTVTNSKQPQIDEVTKAGTEDDAPKSRS